MPLTQRSRSALYHGLTEIIEDEQAVEEMLSYFPARDVEEPITKEFLRAEMADLRAELSGEINGVRNDLTGEINNVRTELLGEISSVRTELLGEISTVRTELLGEINGLRTELLTEMHAGFRRMTVQWYGSMIAFAGVLIAAGVINN